MITSKELLMLNINGVIMVYKLISLFTGAGGFDYYFYNPNYQLLFSNEILENHLSTYAKNHRLSLAKTNIASDKMKNIAIKNDISELKTDGKCDVLIGGPPCQDFSALRGKQNRGGITVKRGQLYKEYLRFLKQFKPKIFFFENVVGMKSANDGLAYNLIQKDFIEAGYDLIYNDILDMKILGVPQNRRRLIIIGIKKEYNKTPDNQNIVKGFLSNNILKDYPLTPIEVFYGKTLDKLNKEYQNIMLDYKDCMKNINNDISKKWNNEYSNLSLNIVEDYANIYNFNDIFDFSNIIKEHKKVLKVLSYKKAIKDNFYIDKTDKIPRSNKKVKERLYHIPPYYNFKAVDGTKYAVKGLMSNIYRRLHPLKPSPTIIAYGGGGTGGYHYEYNRQGLSNRERARLQTFPDNYYFSGNSSEIRAQIGESVPPLASYYFEKISTTLLNDIQ